MSEQYHHHHHDGEQHDEEGGGHHHHHQGEEHRSEVLAAIDSLTEQTVEVIKEEATSLAEGEFAKKAVEKFKDDTVAIIDSAVSDLLDSGHHHHHEGEQHDEEGGGHHHHHLGKVHGGGMASAIDSLIKSSSNKASSAVNVKEADHHETHVDGAIGGWPGIHKIQKDQSDDSYGLGALMSFFGCSDDDGEGTKIFSEISDWLQRVSDNFVESVPGGACTIFWTTTGLMAGLTLFLWVKFQEPHQSPVWWKPTSTSMDSTKVVKSRRKRGKRKSKRSRLCHLCVIPPKIRMNILKCK